MQHYDPGGASGTRQRNQYVLEMEKLALGEDRTRKEKWV
jgi:hypothetical protein